MPDGHRVSTGAAFTHLQCPANGYAAASQSRAAHCRRSSANARRSDHFITCQPQRARRRENEVLSQSPLCQHHRPILDAGSSSMSTAIDQSRQSASAGYPVFRRAGVVSADLSARWWVPPLLRRLPVHEIMGTHGQVQSCCPMDQWCRYLGLICREAAASELWKVQFSRQHQL